LNGSTRGGDAARDNLQRAERALILDRLGGMSTAVVATRYAVNAVIDMP